MVEKYFLLGEAVSASLSPAMMNSAFKSESIDAVYEAVSVSRSDFMGRFLELRQGAAGLNLTIPYKSEVIPMLDDMDPVASRIRAVNVVKHEEERYLGFNTDVNGVMAPLRERRKESLRSALLVGAGGAARAFCEAMSQMDCERITVAARDASRAEAFIQEMDRVFPRIRFNFTALSRLEHSDADIVFNATPIGSGDNPLPEELKRVIYGHSIVFDAVYRPMKTELLKTAEMRGCSTIYGYEMLLGQGTLAFEIWTGRKAPKETMRRALIESLEASA